MAFPSDWGYQLAITIDRTKIDSDLSNWTFVFDQAFNAVLTSVDGPLDADGSAPMINGGGDIRFSSDEAGTQQLAVDVRAAVTDNTPANGELEIAVNIQAISSSANTTIYMWWGKSGEVLPAANSTYGQYNAYDVNHVIVMDMRTWVDRTSNAYDFDTVGYGAPTINNSSSILGKYADFQLGSRRTSATVVHNIGAGSCMFETLIRKTANGWGTEGMASNGYQSPYFAMKPDYTNYGMFWSSALPSTKAWPDTTDYHHVIAYRLSGTFYYYFDGVAAGSAVKGTSIANAYHVLGGSATGARDNIRARMSEYRLHNTNRSEAWIKANNYNFSNAVDFITWGAVTPVGIMPITGVIIQLLDNVVEQRRSRYRL